MRHAVVHPSQRPAWAFALSRGLGRGLVLGLRFWLALLVRQLIVLLVRIMTGVHAVGQPLSGHLSGPCVYFANHTSLCDFLLIWTVVPASQRRWVRPVAAADYWQASALRRFLAHDVFRAVLISRADACSTEPRVGAASDALACMSESLKRGESLIFFPEGTRNTTAGCLLPFKAGLYHLACEHPEVSLVPIWLNNVRHVMPKGHCLPVPMMCTVHVGAALPGLYAERIDVFIDRAQKAVLALKC